MIERIKAHIWESIKTKDVSLAMIFNKAGDILWHKGRNISGNSVYDGSGFPKSHLKEILNNPHTIKKNNVLVADEAGLPGLSESAKALNIKCMIIQSIRDNLFLYVDSGTKKAFSSKDWDWIKIMGLLLGETINHVKEKTIDVGGITGSSPNMEMIRDQVLKYAIIDEPILMTGETGVGKSHVAELIHRYSGRRGRFITVNIPVINENLFESALFGHRKGSFTGADANKRGFVDEAEGGTLFFDEISEVPVQFQARLLRFIDTQKYVVLGDSIEKEADVRIITATNKNLNKAIIDKEFREDLYYRLQILEIHIPPLRERREDIKSLVLENLDLLKGKQIGKGFWEAILAYDWPGNIRELKTVLTRAGIHSTDPITEKAINDIIQKSGLKNSEMSHNTDDDVEQIWAEMKGGKNFWEAVKTPFLNRDLNRKQVKEIVARGLDLTGGKYIGLLDIFHLKNDRREYKLFMAFLRDNQLQ